MKNSEVQDFVAYEYLSINISSSKEDLYIDCYENFGWILTNSVNNGLVDLEDYYINSSNINGEKIVNLKFKRNRKIPNKAKIIMLQKGLEKSLKKLSHLEKEPTSKASIYSVTISVIGTIFLGISLFLIIATNTSIILSIITGFIGIIAWIFSYPVYRSVKLKQDKINTPLIEEEYNPIYNTCEQAQKLLN